MNVINAFENETKISGNDSAPFVREPRGFSFATISLVAFLLCFSPIARSQNVVHPAWQTPNGVWWNNICRAPSGAWWIYPVQAAQPVGTACRIYNTGELGVVTMQ
jgi:hypothetical protein